jgi:hypothetical protein
MTRQRLVAAAAAALLVFLVPVGPSAAANAVRHAVAATSTLTEAKAISRDARGLRLAVAELLGDYLTSYGDRFDDGETTTLTAYKSAADRQLALVVLSANRLRSVVADGGTPAAIRAATLAARATQKRARATAETSFQRARVIVEPKLSLFEGLQALSDYQRMMDRFTALGERTDAITP